MEFNRKHNVFLTQYFDNQLVSTKYVWGRTPFPNQFNHAETPTDYGPKKIIDVQTKPLGWKGLQLGHTHPQSSKSMQSPQKELCNAKIYAGKPNYNQLHFEPWRANIISIWTLQTAISPSNHNLSFSKVSGGRNVQPPNLLDLLATPNASAHCNIPFLPLSNR